MTIPELVNHIHVVTRRSIPAVTDVIPKENTVYFSVGWRRYICDTELRVLEVKDGKVFDSNHAMYQQGVLQGGARDYNGTQIINGVKLT